MKLVWTYNVLAKAGNKTEERKIILINYYILSITTAKKFGYYCIIYTDTESSHFFKDIVDEIHIVDNYENSLQWDCYKILALEERRDNFCLIDGDLILHNKLPNFNDDVVIDTYEVANWKIEYESVVNKFTELGIKNVIDEWDNNRRPVFSCGILYFKDNKYRKLYVKQWKKFNDFLNQHLDVVDIDVATMVGGQYIATLIANHYNLSVGTLTSSLGVDGEYYKHHCGMLKYDRPAVPTDKLIKMERKVII